MFYRALAAFAGLAGMAAASPAISAALQADEVSVSGSGCEIVRILADGREIRSTAGKPAASSRRRGSGRSSSVSVRSRSGSGHASSSTSSSSSSSSSSSGSGSIARAVSSHTDGLGRTVTTTHDERGCSVVIDER